jgi:hypothetical protein
LLEGALQLAIRRDGGNATCHAAREDFPVSIHIPLRFNRESSRLAIGMFLAHRFVRETMETPDESHEATIHETFGEEATAARWVPDLAERLETIERANEALERARELLERISRLEDSRTKAPGE